MITSRNLKYSIPVVSEGGLIIGCETQFDTVRSCEGGWGKCIENCSTGVAVETYGIFSAKNVYGQDCPFSNGQTRACSPIKSCNAFACPSGYQWSGLSLDCLSLNSSHDSNEMCYVAGTSTLNCVNGSASVANVSAVSAPSSTSYNCDCPPPSAPSIPPPPATTYSCGCGVYPDVNTTGCTYVNANKTINGNLYFMYFNCPNNRNGVQCYSQPPHAHYTFNCQSN